MSTSTFSVITAYTPKSGDFVCAPWVGTTRLFVNSPVVVKQAPAKDNTSRTAFAGVDAKGRSINVRTYRLSKAGKVQEAKEMVVDALKRARIEGCKRVVVLLDSKGAELGSAVHEGAVLGSYSFERYLKERLEPLPVVLLGKQHSAATAHDTTIFDAVNFARDILNEPPNIIKPPSLAAVFKKQGRSSGLKVTVWDERRLAKERCGGILAVGQGANAKPRLVIGEYKHPRAKKHLCLVGKGVTFDSGGYCLKPGASQMGMKYDMGGAAMMFAAACAIARLKLPIRLTVLTPLAENDISATAYHTSTILKTRSGISVEVQNTDAEGRLILADALAIAGEKKPDWIIDAATLTGACVVALGDDIAGAYGTDKSVVEKLISAGEQCGEYFWHMPLHQPYAEQLKTTIADCRNLGGKHGGSITAALFLQKFVPEKIPWIHCDIAGPGIKEEESGHLGKGAKGFGVKSIIAFAEKVCCT